MIGAGIGILIGGVTGGIVGSNVSTYENYGLTKFGSDKRKEMERILKIDRKLNDKYIQREWF